MKVLKPFCFCENCKFSQNISIEGLNTPPLPEWCQKLFEFLTDGYNITNQ